MSAKHPVSIPLPYFADPPAWVRYVVDFGGTAPFSFGTHVRPQAFAGRKRAEQWAMATMRAAGRLYGTEKNADGVPCLWSLVYALPANRRGNGVLGDGVCYLAIDAGGVIVKNRPIPAGYGQSKGD